MSLMPLQFAVEEIKPVTPVNSNSEVNIRSLRIIVQSDVIEVEEATFRANVII